MKIKAANVVYDLYVPYNATNQPREAERTHNLRAAQKLWKSTELTQETRALAAK